MILEYKSSIAVLRHKYFLNDVLINAEGNTYNLLKNTDFSTKDTRICDVKDAIKYIHASQP